MNMPKPERMLDNYLSDWRHDYQAYQLVMERPSLITEDTKMRLAGLYNRLCVHSPPPAMSLWNKLVEAFSKEE